MTCGVLLYMKFHRCEVRNEHEIKVEKIKPKKSRLEWDSKSELPSNCASRACTSLPTERSSEVIEADQLPFEVISRQ